MLNLGLRPLGLSLGHPRVIVGLARIGNEKIESYHGLRQRVKGSSKAVSRLNGGEPNESEYVDSRRREVNT